MACHLQPYRYLKIRMQDVIDDDWQLHHSELLQLQNCQVLYNLNACCFFSALADCPFNRSTITCFSRSTLQVFQEEVPRAKARQQLREAQNNDASRGLSEETGWLWGGQDSKSTEPSNSSTSSIRGEIIPMHCNLFSLNPQKTSKTHPTMGIQQDCPLQK